MMVYDVIAEDAPDDDTTSSTSSSPAAHDRRPLASPARGVAPHLFQDADTKHEKFGLGGLFNSMMMTSRTTRSSTRTSYDMVEADEYTLAYTHSRHSPSPHGQFAPVSIPRPRPSVASSATAAAGTTGSKSSRSTTTVPESPKFLRTVSGRNLALRHPTPDLQALQGAYSSNITNLERTAERLSMTSSIDEAIRELHAEQKRNDSRRSSLLSSPSSSTTSGHLHSPDQPFPDIKRQVSNASSIVETNTLARSGGYSPAGFMMSPAASLTQNGRGRSASGKSSRYGSRPEPELEGRPLDSFVNTRKGSGSIQEEEEERAEDIYTFTREAPGLGFSGCESESEHPRLEPLRMTNPDLGLEESGVGLELRIPETQNGEERKRLRPTTSGSGTTFDQAQKAFADFDGEYTQRRSVSGNESNTLPQMNSSGDLLSADNMRRTSSGDPLLVHNMQRRVSSGDMLSVAGNDNSRRISPSERVSLARPQSYADPSTGQQMVFYPAPVPMMLNLPQKLSKMPSSMARNKRRSQVLSTIPPAARQSAIWLPDVLEIEDEPDLPEDDGAQQMEYVAQHQRATMGGRRLTRDIQHLPPQLRANVFFDLPGPNQTVELKEQSAVATLDSILDASAHAPVGAFTDHAFAGHLGAEVYGKPNLRNSRSSSQILAGDQPKKRLSSLNLLRGRRASGSNLLDSETEKRRKTIADIRDGKILRDDDDEDAVVDEEALHDYEGSDDEFEETEEEEYVGAPTTLLAELQLRKQQQKHRTRPLASAFPNGMHSTLLELDAVAQVEQKKRYQKHVKLAWEDSAEQDDDDENDDEDVPLALLYRKRSQVRDLDRPMGLMERRDMEDNEPLSRRRDRLQGRPPQVIRASTMMNLSSNDLAANEDEGGLSATGLPLARPVSGDFASEIMSQFGDLSPSDKGKGKSTPAAEDQVPEEEETLGQRRKRLQAEKEARAAQLGGAPSPLDDGLKRAQLQKRRSMADILAAHPAAGAGAHTQSYSKLATGLLGMQEKASQRRSSTMFNLNVAASGQANAGGVRKGLYNDGQGGIVHSAKPVMPRGASGYFPPQPQFQFPQPSLYPQPSLGSPAYGVGAMGGGGMFANPYAMSPMPMGGMPYPTMGGGYTMPNLAFNPMMMSGGMLGTEPLNQGQIDMVERWRQSIMQ